MLDWLPAQAAEVFRTRVAAEWAQTEAEARLRLQGFLEDLRLAARRSSRFSGFSTTFDSELLPHILLLRIEGVEFGSPFDACRSLMDLLGTALPLMGARFLDAHPPTDSQSLSFLSWADRRLYAGVLSCPLLEVELSGGELVIATVLELSSGVASLEVPGRGVGVAKLWPPMGRLAVGDNVEVFREPGISPGASPVVSLRKGVAERGWVEFTAANPVGSLVRGVVADRVKGGVQIDVEGFPAFLPKGHAGAAPVGELLLEVRRFNRQRRLVVLGHRLPEPPL